jgi:hypothetical protein
MMARNVGNFTEAEQIFLVSSLRQAGKAATTAPNKEVLLRLIRDGRKKGLLKDIGHEQVEHFVRQFLTIVVTNASSSNSSTVQTAGPK